MYARRSGDLPRSYLSARRVQTAKQSLEARRVSVTGVVQGVGFRPFVYQLAVQGGLNGWVQNTSGDVAIVVEGRADQIERFLERLRQGPPQSHIERISVAAEPLRHYVRFEIRTSLVREN